MAPVISPSRYARAASKGTVKSSVIAGGIICELMSKVVPVIVRFLEKHGVEAAGQTFTVHVLFAGAIELLLGTETPENAPEPSRTRGFCGMVVFLSNGTPFQKY